MCTFLEPRHYTDTEIPLFKDKFLISAHTTEEYKFYLDWLSDHLYNEETEINVEENLAEDIKERKFKAGGLGVDAFYHQLYCIEPYEGYPEENIDYEQAYNEFAEQHRELYENEIDPDCIDPLEEWINPTIWENAKREYEESKDVLGSHVDLGYREQLRSYLEGIKKHENRYSILHQFYKSYNDEAGK
jgi:hypothetical protein